MISGARELMTPGAWRKDGFTYSLNSPPSAPSDTSVERREQLERLRTALWQFAATNEGRFPSTSERDAIADERWLVPGGSDLRYVYAPGLRAGKAAELLAWEPELEPNRRWVLLTNGEIVVKSSAEITAQRPAEKRP